MTNAESFLAVKVKEHDKWSIDHRWLTTPAYAHCPADTPEAQISCVRYEALDTIGWWCKYCGDSSDICNLLQCKEDFYV